MKKNITSGNPQGTGRRRGFLPRVYTAIAGFSLTAAAVLLPGCAKEDTHANDGELLAVEFRAAVASASRLPETVGISMRSNCPTPAPTTRTTNGGNEWTAGDLIGIFMVAHGGNPLFPITAGGTKADNLAYKAFPQNPATTASFSPEGQSTIFYPQSGSVDFIAYYPFTEQLLPDPVSVFYGIDIEDQSDEQKQLACDVLYARTTDVSKSKAAVNLEFSHVLSKVTLNLTAGDGIADTDVQNMPASDVAFEGTPVTAQMNLHDGSLEKYGTGDFSPLKTTAAGSVWDASFTALVIPQKGTITNRKVSFKVGGRPLVWNIPDNMEFLAGEHYSIPLTLKLTQVEAGDLTIGDWNPSPNSGGSGEADQVMIVQEANSYMAEPYSAAFLIPVSQANRVLDGQDEGASTTGLTRVTADNYTVELVWSDTPVGPGGVIREMYPYKNGGDGYIWVEPGIAGNAVIAIRDKDDGKIKWSWHIWVTDPITTAYDPVTEITWMDRNLGAKYSIPFINSVYNEERWVGTVGLHYQWGRKDAFPSSDGYNGNQIYYTSVQDAGTTDKIPTGNYSELSEMVQNPFGFALNTNYWGSVADAYVSNNSWGAVTGKKTIYDPCPPGWKVPAHEVDTDMYSWGDGADNDGESWTFLNYRTDYKGALFNGSYAPFGISVYFPVSGFRSNRQLYLGGTVNAGERGYYWLADASVSGYSYGMSIGPAYVTVQNAFERAFGFSVRCVAE